MLHSSLSARLVASLATLSLGAGALAQGSPTAPVSSRAPATTPSPRPSAAPTPAPAPAPSPTFTPSPRPAPSPATPQPSPAPAPAATATPAPALSPAASAASAAVAPAAELAGNWDLRIDGTTIFRFTIERTSGGGWQGRWQRPESFNSNGNAFANLRGGVKSSTSMAGNAVLELVELAFDDPRPGAVPDIFRFRLIGPDAVAMAYVGTQLPPYLLVRADADDPLGNWDSERIYRRPVPGARPIAPGAGAPDPAEAGTTAPPAAEGRPAAPPRRRIIQPTDDGRIILGPPIPFLDLTRRPAASEPSTGTEEAPAAEGAPGAAAAPPAAPSPPTATPAAPASPAPDGPAQAEPQVGEDFLEGL